MVPVSATKCDGSKQLCRRDIDVNNSFIIVSFKWTKTIQVGNRVLRLPLTAISNSKFCPVHAYTGMCELNPFLPILLPLPHFIRKLSFLSHIDKYNCN